MKKRELILALDLETNHNNKPRYDIDNDAMVLGLHETKILEVGYILALLEIDTETKDYELTELSRDSSMVFNDRDVWKDAPQVVIDMHEASGFKDRYDAFCAQMKHRSEGLRMTERDVSQYFFNDIKAKLVKEGFIQNIDSFKFDILNAQFNEITLLGKNPQFDLSFLNAAMGELASLINYRPIDASLLRNAVNLFREQKLKGVSRTPSKHTTIADCEAAIADFIVLLDVIKYLKADNVEFLEDLFKGK